VCATVHAWNSSPGADIGGGVKDDKSPPLREKEKYITKNITSQVTLLANERV